MAKTNEFQHMETFARLVTVEVFEKIVKQAITDAENGDAAARAWVGLYCMGRPMEVPCKLSGIDVQLRMNAQSDEFLSALYPPKKGRK